MTEPDATTTEDAGTEQLPEGHIWLELSNHMTWPPHPDPDAEDYRPGDSVAVTRDEARGIIAAGYAACDAEDVQDVARALQLGVYAVTEPGTVVDYGAVGQGVGQLHTGPLLVAPVAGAALEAGLDPRDGRNDDAPDDTWHVSELRKLATTRGANRNGGKDALLERLTAPVEATAPTG